MANMTMFGTRIFYPGMANITMFGTRVLPGYGQYDHVWYPGIPK